MVPMLARVRDMLESFFLLGMTLNLLPNPMSGLVVVWWWNRSLGSVWLAVVYMLVLLVLHGLEGGGVIWIYSLHCLMIQ